MIINEIIDIIRQFGKEKIIILLLMMLVFFLINSLVKRNKIRLVLSFFSSLFILLQLFSLYFTQSFVGYQFYVHANLRDVIGLQNLFILQIILGVITLVGLAVINFYAYFIFKKLGLFIKYSNRKLYVLKVVSVIVLIIIFQGDFVADSKTLLPIFTYNNNTEDFDRVLKKYNMSDYVKPNEIECSAGNNIIIISMESLERGFLSEKFASLTPNLNQLKQEWNYFDLHPNKGSNWTSGSLYTCLTGFPAFFGYKGNDVFKSVYHSNISSISNVLNKADYQTTFIVGNADFSGTKEMLHTFHFNKVIDYKSNIGASEKTNTLLGLHDRELFDIAKSEIKNYKRTKKQFSVFISTVDTHFPNGIYDKKMESVITPKNTNIEFAIASLDYLVGDFVSFLEKEGVLENTTVFLFPDHKKMGNPSLLKGTGKRSLYVITNSKNIELKNNNNFYQIDLPKIILNGSNVKHNLKFLTDYILQPNKQKYIKEHMIELTEINTNGILNSKIKPLKFDKISKNYTNYKKDTLRFIAHAGGNIDGKNYTNSKEALDRSYQKGFRLFELDIIKTKDDKYVASHDWKTWAKQVNYKGETPVLSKQFMSKKIWNKYTPLDMKGINEWFKNHDDAILVSDKINDPIKFSELFVDKKRLIMELFDEEAVQKGLSAGILSAMPSESVIRNYNKKDIQQLSQKGVKYIAVSRYFAINNQKLLKTIKQNNIKCFIYNIKKSGVNEEYMLKYELDNVWGIYADKWSFH